jgi:hypothetical protein
MKRFVQLPALGILLAATFLSGCTTARDAEQTAGAVAFGVGVIAAIPLSPVISGYHAVFGEHNEKRRQEYRYVRQLWDEAMKPLPRDRDATQEALKLRGLSFRASELKKGSVVWITGAVKNEGYITIKSGATIGEVVQVVGGFTRDSSRWRLMLIRFDAQGAKTALIVTFSSQMPSKEEIANSTVLLPGDILFAPDS